MNTFVVFHSITSRLLAFVNLLTVLYSQEYLDATKKHYLAEAMTLDFAGDAAGSKDTINKWVEQQTNNKIKDLIPDGFIDGLTRLILVNAIYFKGNSYNN